MTVIGFVPLFPWSPTQGLNQLSYLPTPPVRWRQEWWERKACPKSYIFAYLICYAYITHTHKWILPLGVRWQREWCEARGCHVNIGCSSGMRIKSISAHSTPSVVPAPDSRTTAIFIYSHMRRWLRFIQKHVYIDACRMLCSWTVGFRCEVMTGVVWGERLPREYWLLVRYEDYVD